MDKRHALNHCQNQILCWSTRSCHLGMASKTQLCTEPGPSVCPPAASHTILSVKCLMSLPTLHTNLCFGPGRMMKNDTHTQKKAIKCFPLCRAGERIFGSLACMAACSVNKHWHVQITAKEENSLGHLDK